MLSKFRHLLVIVIAGLVGLSAIAADDPAHERHELMEGVREAAKPMGEMLRGDSDYDAAVVMNSLTTFKDAAAVFGDLFPEGTETGGETEAAPAIWEDRDGFNQRLTDWASATDAAIAAAPQTLEAAGPVLGDVFKTCKGCHDTYRIEKDD